MRRLALVLIVLAAAVLGVAQAGAAPTCTTSAVQDGDWATAQTWSAGVPAAGVDACIPAGRRVTIGSTTMAGPGTTTVQDGGTLAVVNYPTLGDGRILDIEPGGVLDLTVDNRYVSRTGTTAFIRNRGTIVRTASGTNDADLRVPVENDGTVVSQTGRLVLSGGGSGSSGAYGGGPGAVELGGGVHALEDGATLLGGVELTAGGLSVAGGATAASTGTNTMSGGTISGPGAVSVDAGSLTWSGGTMAGPGTTTVKPGATLLVSSWTTLSEGRVLANQGTLELPTDNRYIARSGAAPLIRNSGAIVRTAAGANDVDLRVPVENHGTITATTGRLVLSNGGSGSTGSYGGAGAGTVELGGGVHAVEQGAKLLGSVELTAGELGVAAGATVTSTGANTVSGGRVSGPGGLSVDSGTLTWSGGTMAGPGTTTVKAPATLRNASWTTLSEGRVLDNQGTIDFPTENRYIARSGAAPVIRNTGTIRRTAAGAGDVDVRVPVENDGTVLSDAGALLLSNGGSAGSSGTFGGGPGTVRLQSGGWQLDDGADLQGGVTIAGTTVSIPAGATVTATGAPAMTSGMLAGDGTLAVASGTLTWSGGTMAGGGTTSVAQGATLALTGTGSVSLGGTRRLDVAGLADFKGDSGMGVSGTGAEPVLHVLPTGTLRKSGGTLWSYVSVPVRNDGTADGQAGELMLTEGAAQPHSGLFKGKSATEQVVLGGEGHVLTSAAQLEDFAEIAGDVAVRDGDTLTLAGDALQTGGELSGDVRVTGTLAWSGGSHEAPGTTTIAPGGRIVVGPESGTSCRNGILGDGRRVENAGLLRLAGGADITMFGEQRAEIHNAGRIELDSAGACGTPGLIGDALVANTPAGTIEKLGGAGDSQVSNLDNDGVLLNSAAGDLRIDSNAAIGHTGVFRSTGAGAIAFDFGDFVLEPGAVLDGDVVVSGGDLRLPEGMTLDVAAGDTLRQTAGTISGAGDVRVLGALVWSNGDQIGTGSTLVEPGGTVAVAPEEGDDSAFADLRGSRALVNRGAMTVEDAFFGVHDGASVLNRGSLELRGDSEVEGFGFGDGYDSLVHNTGMLRKTGASTIEFNAPLDNDGTLDVQQGLLDVATLLNFSESGFLGEGGIVGGEYLVKGTLAVPGLLDVNAARLVLDGADAKVVTRDFLGRQQDALGLLHRNAGGGELVLRGGRDLTSPDDRGPFLNQGVLELGPGSVLQAKGFRQASGAVLRPAVTAGGAGRVTATGPAQLGGRLDTPAAPALAGDHLVLSAPAIAGGFSAVSGGYAAQVSGTEVRLRPPPGVQRRAGASAGAEAEFGVSAPPVELRPADAPAAGAQWERRPAVLRAARRGARLTVPAVRARDLALAVRTCRRCGSVRVSWAGRKRTIRLTGRAGRRTIRVFALGRARTGTVRLRTLSARRVAVRALLVRP